MAKIRSPRVLAFVHEYVWGAHAGNGARSLVAAGLAKGDVRKARRYSYELLRKPAVKALVEAETAEKETQLKQKAARAAEETFLLATADIRQLFDADDKLLAVRKMPAQIRRAIASIEVEKRVDGRGEDAEVYYVTKVKLHDKRAAQELFLKYAGKLKDKIEVEAGATLEQLVLQADRLYRERQARAAKK
jgi:hypothetical protein